MRDNTGPLFFGEGREPCMGHQRSGVWTWDLREWLIGMVLIIECADLAADHRGIQLVSK